MVHSRHCLAKLQRAVDRSRVSKLWCATKWLVWGWWATVLTLSFLFFLAFLSRFDLVIADHLDPYHRERTLNSIRGMKQVHCVAERVEAVRVDCRCVRQENGVRVRGVWRSVFGP
jgi:hypothetical protein